MNSSIDCPFSNEGTRNDVRLRIIFKFSEEVPGTGNGELASKYRYNVEELEDGSRIFLMRPAFNKNGYDFVIHVENHVFSNGKTNPSHRDILNELELKRATNANEYTKLYTYLRQVYSCEDVAEPLLRALQFPNGYTAEMIAKVTKWFYIEQDIRYWNYSGRAMFFSKIPRP